MAASAALGVAVALRDCGPRAQSGFGTPHGPAAASTPSTRRVLCRAAPRPLQRANALAPAKGASVLAPRVPRRRPSRAGRVAAAADGSGAPGPKPDFATPGDFDGRYTLKYLYDGGASLAGALRS